MTVTRVTPPQAAVPPGTVISYEKMPAVATISRSSKTASVRSNSVISRLTASSSSVGAAPPKVRRSDAA
jgi:hypothetical protein